MPHATLSVRVNHVFKGTRYSVGDVYEFDGTKEELRELVDGGLVETDVNLGKVSVAADVKKYRNLAETEQAARIERDATIVTLEAEKAALATENDELKTRVSDLETTLTTVDETAAEMRKVLDLPEDGVILTAIKELVKKAKKAGDS